MFTNAALTMNPITAALSLNDLVSVFGIIFATGLATTVFSIASNCLMRSDSAPISVVNVAIDPISSSVNSDFSLRVSS